MAVFQLLIITFVAAIAPFDINIGQEWVNLPVSASSNASSLLFFGLAAQHHFEYRLARLAFRESMVLEPGLAMNYVGLAMSFIQGSWSTEQPQLAAAVLAEWDNMTQAGQVVPPLPHESDYLQAIRPLVNLSISDVDTRHQMHLDAMRKVAAKYPDLVEIQMGLAVALLTVLAPSSFGFYDRAAPLIAEVQTLLMKAQTVKPLHPGVVHYFVHIFDSPQYAQKGLVAAKMEGTMAPDSPHANHMPAHIFIRLGMWQEAARAGQNAIEVSLALAQSLGDVSWLDHHSEQFHVYVLIQLGQWQAAANSVTLVSNSILGLQVISEGWQEGLDFVGYDVSVFPARTSCDTCDDPSQLDFMYQLSYQVYTGVLCNTGLYAAGFNRSAIVTCVEPGCVFPRPTVVDQNLAQKVVAELNNVSALLSMIRPQYAQIASMAANMVEGVRLINSATTATSCQNGLKLLAEASAQEIELSPYVPGPQTMLPAYQLYAEMLLLVDSMQLQVPGSSNGDTAFTLLSNLPQLHNGSNVIMHDMNHTRALFLFAQAAARVRPAIASELFEHVLSNYAGADSLNIASPVSQPAITLLQRRIAFATTKQDQLKTIPKDTADRVWFVPFVVVACVATVLLFLSLCLFNRLRRRHKQYPLL